jgi:2-aminophenol/2-amino-5-chlorophenol 1,6-dioxygenase alpha subunit
MKSSLLKKAYVLPGLPQPLLSPQANPGYQRLRDAFQKVALEIEALNPDVLLIYSTMWPSILGHQIQTRAVCEWTHVDEEFHDLGSISYKMKMDSELAHEVCRFGNERGLQMKSVDYHGFPIDTGTVVVNQLVNPTGKFKSVIFSSNIYADRAETVVLAKAGLDALKQHNKSAVCIIVSSLSNRLHSEFIDPAQDKIQSLKDQEWNLKILEFLEKGRLEDVAQLSRQIQKEARVKKVNNFKPFWWLSTMMGSHNRFSGEVLAYEPVYGVGCAVVGLLPALQSARDLEFDEDSPDRFLGERNVLADVATMGDFSSQTLMAGEEDPRGDS